MNTCYGPEWVSGVHLPLKVTAGETPWPWNGVSTGGGESMLNVTRSRGAKANCMLGVFLPSPALTASTLEEPEAA